MKIANGKEIIFPLSRVFQGWVAEDGRVLIGND